MDQQGHRKPLTTGDRIWEACATQGLSLLQLHKVSGVSYNTILDLVRNKRRAQPKTIGRLARALKVPPDALRGGELED